MPGCRNGGNPGDASPLLLRWESGNAAETAPFGRSGSAEVFDPATRGLRNDRPATLSVRRKRLSSRGAVVLALQPCCSWWPCARFTCSGGTELAPSSTDDRTAAPRIIGSCGLAP